MEAPKEIYIPNNIDFVSRAILTTAAKGDDIKYIRSDKAVDRDTLKEEILKLGGYGNVGEYDHGFSDAVCTVIDKIDNL